MIGWGIVTWLGISFVVGAALGVARANRSGGERSLTESEARAFGAESGRISDHDLALVESVGAYPNRWNQTAALFVSEYTDPDIAPAAFLVSAPRYVSELTTVIDEFESQLDEMDDQRVADVFRGITGSYREKLVALGAIVDAVRAGDPEAEASAQEALNAAGQRSLEVGGAFVDRFREFMSEEDLQRIDGAMQAAQDSLDG